MAYLQANGGQLTGKKANFTTSTPWEAPREPRFLTFLAVLQGGIDRRSGRERIFLTKFGAFAGR
jgi:hypothetical protein